MQAIDHANGNRLDLDLTPKAKRPLIPQPPRKKK